MKLSVHDYDKYDMETLSLCNRSVVLLDGVEVKYCTESDEDEGYIIRLKLSSDGHPYLSGDEFETEKLTGNVKITDPLENKS